MTHFGFSSQPETVPNSEIEVVFFAAAAYRKYPSTVARNNRWIWSWKLNKVLRSPNWGPLFLVMIWFQVMWNLLFEPLIGNFKSDVKFLIWIFFLWQLISCQTLKLRPKINVCKKNQISDRKIKSCWIDLIWNLLLDLTWFIFAVFDVKSWPGKEGLNLPNIDVKTKR